MLPFHSYFKPVLNSIQYHTELQYILKHIILTLNMKKWNNVSSQPYWPLSFIKNSYFQSLWAWWWHNAMCKAEVSYKKKAGKFNLFNSKQDWDFTLKICCWINTINAQQLNCFFYSYLKWNRCSNYRPTLATIVV